MKHGRPQWGEEANVGAAPRKYYENKRFATYSSLWGAFLLCQGLSATFLHMETLFRHVGAFLLLFSPYGRPFSRCGLFCYFVLLLGGFFFHVGGLFGLVPPHPTKIFASTHGPCHDINFNVKFVENIFASA